MSVTGQIRKKSGTTFMSELGGKAAIDNWHKRLGAVTSRVLVRNFCEAIRIKIHHGGFGPETDSQFDKPIGWIINVHGRHNFTAATKRKLFDAAGYVCSNPDCQKFHRGPTEDGSGTINQGRAAHITAASPNGPRYDPTLTEDERRHADNGIWLCIVCANLIDEDEDQFPIDKLNQWKIHAQREAHLRVVEGIVAPQSATALNATLKKRLQRAVADDITKFRGQQGWPSAEIELGFRIISSDNHQVTSLAGLCDGLSVNTELLLTSPPGTGKTTTMIQIADKLVKSDDRVPFFLPLKEWAQNNDDVVDAILARNAFAAFSRQEIFSLAENGELAVLLDGWNELGATAKHRAVSQITALRRDFPLLRLITSTRRETVDLPFGGIRADILALSEQQQLQIAKSMLGASGHDLLDRAWRTPGIRNLVAIPLYLTVLLVAAPDGKLPDTKEQLLGLLVEHHEKGAGESRLRETTQGEHTGFLAALAFDALSRGEVAIADDRAKKAVAAEGKRLVELGQIAAVPQPTAVLDALVAHHVLIRSDDGLISFQHQQFQEWFASLKVEQLMIAAIDDADAMQALKKDVFNYPIWEEAILFSVERMSSQEDQHHIVSVCVMEALSVDPMLAAEMIFCSSDAVWSEIGDDIIKFADRWHQTGTVDRAVGFMIKSGKADFAEAFWPLASDPDMQVHLVAMRAAKPFRIGVLGDNIADRLRTLDEETKTHLLGELIMNGDATAMEQAAALVKQDPSSKLRVDAIGSLDFRRADRLIIDLLNASEPTVWRSVAAKGLRLDLDDEEVNARLAEEQNKLLSEETDLGQLLRYITYGHETENTEDQLAELISRPDFPAREQDIGWTLQRTYERFPTAVRQGVLQRIKQGLKLPWGSDDLVDKLPVIDDGEIAKRALVELKERGEDNDAIKIAGSETIGKLIDRAIEQQAVLNDAAKPAPQDEIDVYFALRDRIVRSRFEPFAQAVLARGSARDLPTITLLADLLSHHRSVDRDKHLPEPEPEPETVAQLHNLIESWAKIVLASAEANRHDLSEIVRVIGCFPDQRHLLALTELQREDLKRWRAARAQRLHGIHNSESAMSYGWQFRYAFAAIGGEDAAEALEEHLLDDFFGEDAAHGLRDIYDRRTGTQRSIRSFPDFARVGERRAAKAASGREETAPEAAAILSAIRTLLDGERTETELHRAIELGFVAFQMPVESGETLAAELLELPLPWGAKLSLIKTLTNVGHVPSANMVLAGIKEWIALAERETWRRDQRKFELIDWLKLLPFSNQSEATLEGFDLIRGQKYRHYEYRKLLYALRAASGESAEAILIELAKREPNFISMHEWLDALLTRQTPSSLLSLLDLLDDGIAPSNARIDAWSVTRLFKSLTAPDAALIKELLARFGDSKHVRSQSLMDGLLAETGKTEAILAMVKVRAKRGYRFDNVLRQAIENAVTNHRPVDGSTNSYYVEGSTAAKLRQDLFAFYCEGGAIGAIAKDCLVLIDELRDQYGHPEDETRHPDISSEVAWPPGCSLKRGRPYLATE